MEDNVPAKLTFRTYFQPKNHYRMATFCILRNLKKKKNPLKFPLFIKHESKLVMSGCPKG